MKKDSSFKEDYAAYADIIDLPNHRSKTHPHMPLLDRAAQFSPFAALSGHEAAIKETARLTEKKVALTEEVKAELDAKLSLIADNLANRPKVTITYFLPDEEKEGGAYVSETGVVVKIDKHKRLVVLADEVFIPIPDILSIEGKLFDTSAE